MGRMGNEVLIERTEINEIARKKLAKSVLQNAIKIGNKVIAWVPVELLVIPPYQRQQRKHVKMIAENWNPDKCNVLLVAYDASSGSFNVMDGQHRAAAAKMREVEYLVCEIHQNLTVSQEASFFVGQGDNDKKLTPFDTFHANQFLTESEETETSRIDKIIKKVCDKYNIAVRKSNSCNCLKSVTEARAIVKRGGEEALKYVFDVITESQWFLYSEGYGGDLTNAISMTYQKYLMNNEIKTRLVWFFRGTNPVELIAMGNNTYPNLGRRARLNAIINDIIADPADSNKKSAKRSA